MAEQSRPANGRGAPRYERARRLSHRHPRPHHPQWGKYAAASRVDCRS